jgi:hypothetical protein
MPGGRTSLRQGHGLPPIDRQSGTNGFTIPPMPVAWTPEVVRILFPIPLALGRKVTFVRALPEPVLVLIHAGERTFPSTAKGWVDLWTTIGQTTRPEAVKMAVLQVRNAMRWAENTPFRDALAGLEAEAKARLVFDGLVFLGGHDYGTLLRPGAVVDLRMTADAVVLTDVTDGSRAHTFPVSQLRELEAIDPATVMNDGLATPSRNGSSGGLPDQATAVWMTESAGKSSIMALVRIVTDTSELLLRSMTAAPDAAQVALAPLRRRLARNAIVAVAPPATHRPAATRKSDASAPPPAPAPAHAGPAADGDDDFVSRLERLAHLRDSGALSDYEYLVAKTKLLS